MTVLKEGDIINVDVTVYLDGYHGDCSETFPVGAIDDDAMKLIQVCHTNISCWQHATIYFLLAVPFSFLVSSILLNFRQRTTAGLLRWTSASLESPTKKLAA